jgi:lipopolysaccharide export system permease protein
MIRYLARLMVQFPTAHAVIVTPFDRYIGAAALKAFVLVAAALTALFSLLEFVDQLSFIGQGRYGLTDALAYVLLTAPFRLLQVTPVSMLLGCLLALGEFARNYELIALQSLGISEIRIIGAVLKLAVPVIVALFIMAEFVIPPSQQLAQAQRTAALSSGADLRSDTSFWAQGDHQYLNVQRFESRTAARNIDIYAFAGDGNLTSFIHAERADIRPDGTWHLIDVVRKRVDNSIFETEHLPTLDWFSFVSAEEIRFLTLPPETIPPIALYRYVHDLGQRHQQAIRYEQELWRRASIPLSIVAMILIAAPFVFGLPRGQSTGRQIAIGAVFGIVFSLSQQIVGHLNLLLYLNPAVAAMAPSLALIVLASYLFRRARR